MWRCVGPIRGEHIHRQQGDEERQGREGGSRGWRKFGGSACCGIYIPCLATISIGQDRKYTIEGSSATDKDYPTENKTKQKRRQMAFLTSDWQVQVRSSHKRERTSLERKCAAVLQALKCRKCIHFGFWATFNSGTGHLPLVVPGVIAKWQRCSWLIASCH